MHNTHTVNYGRLFGNVDPFFFVYGSHHHSPTLTTRFDKLGQVLIAREALPELSSRRFISPSTNLIQPKSFGVLKRDMTSRSTRSFRTDHKLSVCFRATCP